MTNLEKIRQMNDKELADFLSFGSGCKCCNIYLEGETCNAECYEGHKAWLNSEVEE